jgi:hypothetical protein
MIFLLDIFFNLSSFTWRCILLKETTNGTLVSSPKMSMKDITSSTQCDVESERKANSGKMELLRFEGIGGKKSQTAASFL